MADFTTEDIRQLGEALANATKSAKTAQERRQRTEEFVKTEEVIKLTKLTTTQLKDLVKNNKGKGFRPVSGKQIPPGGVGTRYIPDGMTLIEAINQNEIYKDPKGKRRA